MKTTTQHHSSIHDPLDKIMEETSFLRDQGDKVLDRRDFDSIQQSVLTIIDHLQDLDSQAVNAWVESYMKGLGVSCIECENAAKTIVELKTRLNKIQALSNLSKD